MFDATPDPVLPGLQHLTDTDLARITGASDVQVLRLRHQPGSRAVLHVAFHKDGVAGEGVVWFFWAEKTEKLRQALPQMRVDAATGAAFEAFPQDHRVPEIARFMADTRSFAPALLGATAQAKPQLVRYRPGLSATFRWVADTGAVHFVKIARKADVVGQAALIASIAGQMHGSARVSDVSGHVPQIGAIAYRAAQGAPFDKVLAALSNQALADATAQMVGGLAGLWACALPGAEAMEHDEYLRRAERSATIIASADAEAGQRARTILNRAADQRPVLRQCPIHGDMKLDHAFLDGTTVTLIDTESVKLGDPDHDLALLDARLDLHRLQGTLTADQCTTIRSVLRQAAGPDYSWFLQLAKLHAAKFLAQRDGPFRAAQMRQILA